MHRVHLIPTSTVIETIIWLIVLLALRFQEERELPRLRKTQPSTQQDSNLNYTPFKVFASLRILGNLAYLGIAPIAHELRIPAATVSFGYSTIYWSLYFLQAVAVFLIMSSLIRSSLRPLPGLAYAALVVFRWAAALIFVMAVTAHAPVFRANNWHNWLNELCVSFQFCVCSFELTLLVLLLVHMRRLGMFVRSRVIGFALGLAVFGLSDYVAGFLIIAAPDMINVSNITLESVAALTAAIWLYYIVMPEPKRQPHSLSPASSLMKWNEVALKLGMGGRQAEQVPFISGVESKVDAVLDRFKSRAS